MDPKQINNKQIVYTRHYYLLLLFLFVYRQIVVRVYEYKSYNTVLCHNDKKHLIVLSLAFKKICTKHKVRYLI